MHLVTMVTVNECGLKTTIIGFNVKLYADYLFKGVYTNWYNV